MPKRLSYWKRRQIEDAYHMFQEAEDVANEIGALYGRATGYISQQAEGIFDRFRRKYGLSEADALALLNTLHDKTSIDDLMLALQSSSDKEEREALKRELTSAAFRARIERLRELQSNLDSLMAKIGIQETEKSTNLFRKIIEEAYNRHMYNLQQRLGVHFDFSQISEKAVERILSSNWSGEHYSKRIWKNTNKLAKRLKEELFLNLLTGRTVHETIQKIMEMFHVGYREARRLILTETSHVMNEADEKAREEAGIDMYLYLATLDLRTSKICRSLDGKIFKVSEREVGKNFPPMHPHCRSTTIDYFGEEWIKKKTRVARDPETGRNIKVPMTMTYEDWYEEFVKDPENSLNTIGKDDNIKTQDQFKQEGTGVSIPEQYQNNFDDFEELDLSEEERATLSELHKRALETGHEYGQAITKDGITKPFSSNNESYVDIPNEILEQERIVFYHAHTNVTPPSAKDLELLCRDNVDGVCVITSNGDVFLASLGDGYRPSLSEYKDAMLYIQMDVDSDILDREEVSTWSPEERIYVAVREQAYRLVREFGWTMKGGRL